MSAGGYHAIVLAAGSGSRFGGSKLTAAYGGGVLLDAVLGIACAAPVESIVVVTGAHGEAVGAAVAAFASRSGAPIRSVDCADHAAGMSASLRCGLTALPEASAGAFIFLGDMPRIPPKAAGELLKSMLGGALAAVPSVNGRWGHPVLISRALFDGFSRDGGDGGGRGMLRGLGTGLAVVQVGDEGVLADADTPAEMEALSRIASDDGPEHFL